MYECTICVQFIWTKQHWTQKTINLINCSVTCHFCQWRAGKSPLSTHAVVECNRWAHIRSDDCVVISSNCPPPQPPDYPHQAPLPETFTAFWSMVWEQRAAVLVMLTSLTEHGERKADQYWPVNGSLLFDDLTVTHVETVEFAYHNVRTLCLRKKG